MENESHALNEHASAGSMTVQPTVDEVDKPVFRLARSISPECASQLQFRMACAGCDRHACVASDEDHYRYCCPECVSGTHSAACDEFWPAEQARMLVNAEPGMIVIVPMKTLNEPWIAGDDRFITRRFASFRIIEPLGDNRYRGKLEYYEGIQWDGPELIVTWNPEQVWFEVARDQRQSGKPSSATPGVLVQSQKEACE